MPSLIDELLGKIDEARAQERGSLHYHKCPEVNCGHIWSHRAADFKSSQDFEDGHTCPVCKHGKQSWKCDANGKLTH